MKGKVGGGYYRAEGTLICASCGLTFKTFEKYLEHGCKRYVSE